jgi:WD40 repeat protein|eukprot:g2449.t1
MAESLYLTARSSFTSGQEFPAATNGDRQPSKVSLAAPQSALKFMSVGYDSKYPSLITGSSSVNSRGFSKLQLLSLFGSEWRVENAAEVRGGVTDIATGESFAVVATSAGLLNFAVVGIMPDGSKSLNVTKSWSPPRSLEGKGATSGLDIFQGSGRVVAVSETGSIDMCQIGNSEFSNPICNTTPNCTAYNDVTFMTNPNSFVVVGDRPTGQIEVWDVAASCDRPQLTFTHDNHSRVRQNCVARHPARNEILATGSSEGSVSIWDLRKGDTPFVKMQEAHAGDVWSLRFHTQDPGTIVSVGEDGNAFRWSYVGAGEKTPERFTHSPLFGGASQQIVGNHGSPANSVDIDGMTDAVAVAYDMGVIVCGELN